jgi:hypothetical protein
MIPNWTRSSAVKSRANKVLPELGAPHQYLMDEKPFAFLWTLHKINKHSFFNVTVLGR